jgi:8-oxo-dGTP pyrophosphatase MutT (NUDIX family)
MALPPKRVVRLAMTAVQRIRRAYWYVRRPETRGVHAAAFSKAGRIILVRHSYAPGWRLPGGGVKGREEPQAAMLRELREEIGLLSWHTMRHMLDFEHRPDFRRGHGALFRLDGVEYNPKRSLEIEDIAEFDPDSLPAGTTMLTLEMIEAARAFPEAEQGIAGEAGEA